MELSVNIYLIAENQVEDYHRACDFENNEKKKY